MTLRAVSPPPGPPPPSADHRRVVVLVCDSLGIGGAPDAAAYGDDGANTLANVAAAAGGLDLPTLERWGLGRLTDVVGVPAVDPPGAVVARLVETAAGKDSTTGHWELMGCRVDVPFPTYPEGFPTEVVQQFERVVGGPVLGNRPASGTLIIAELGEQHLRTGAPILYTSGDSVFQVAAHEDVVPLATLYDWCAAARAFLTGPHRVGRVIARPFTGPVGGFRRTGNRRDFAVAPPDATTCDILHAAGVPVIGIGKIEDLFAGRGITWSDHTADNVSSLAATSAALARGGPAFVFVNLVDFDQLYGHRNDSAGYGACLVDFDRRLGDLAASLGSGDRLIITADHGTDPTRASTDHTRERVPMIAWGPDLAAGADLGVRATMADVGATVLELFGLTASLAAGGASFAGALMSLHR